MLPKSFVGFIALMALGAMRVQAEADSDSCKVDQEGSERCHKNNIVGFTWNCIHVFALTGCSKHVRRKMRAVAITGKLPKNALRRGVLKLPRTVVTAKSPNQRERETVIAMVKTSMKSTSGVAVWEELCGD